MVVNLGFGAVFGGHTGSSPSPFDAINGPRLAGGEPLPIVATGIFFRVSRFTARNVPRSS